jgi:hypothetical protein
MTKYRKRPVVIDAWQVQPIYDHHVEWIIDIDGVPTGLDVCRRLCGGPEPGKAHLHVRTPEGTMRADQGAWIIRGVKGELYPCADDVFRATYEPA